MMTRRDFTAIAAALADSRPPGDNSKAYWLLGQWSADVHGIADVLAADNPRFDRARFYRACGLQEGGA